MTPETSRREDRPPSEGTRFPSAAPGDPRLFHPTSAVTPERRQRQRRNVHYCAVPGVSPRLGSCTPGNSKLGTETEAFSTPDAQRPRPHHILEGPAADEAHLSTEPPTTTPNVKPATAVSLHPRLPVPSLRAGPLAWWTGRQALLSGSSHSPAGGHRAGPSGCRHRLLSGHAGARWRHSPAHQRPHVCLSRSQEAWTSLPPALNGIYS